MKYITMLFVLLFGLAGCDSLKLLKGSSTLGPTAASTMSPELSSYGQTSVNEEKTNLVLVIADPDTGRVTYHLITAKTPEEAKEQIARAFGTATPAERKLFNEVVQLPELRKLKGVRCAYIASYRTYGYLDPFGRYWDGVVYHGGKVPILEIMESGFAKSVVFLDGVYQIRYFPLMWLSDDRSRTDDYLMNEGRLSADSLLPELCPRDKQGQKI